LLGVLAREFVHFTAAVCRCFVENVNKIQALIPYLEGSL